MTWILFACLLGAYLLGAVPFGYLIGRLHGVDLRTVGSGNIGATNVTRTLGRSWGVGCFVLDALKGTVPMVAALIWLRPAVLGTGGSVEGFIGWWLLVGLLAILGHVFPVTLGFRGGKGVATSFGVALGLWPYYTLTAVLCLAIWALALRCWRYVSLASILATTAFPLLLLVEIACVPTWTLRQLWPLLPASLVIPAMVVWRHRENLRRLRAGTEHKIGTSRSETTP